MRFTPTAQAAVNETDRSMQLPSPISPVRLVNRPTLANRLLPNDPQAPEEDQRQPTNREAPSDCVATAMEGHTRAGEAQKNSEMIGGAEHEAMSCSQEDERRRRSQSPTPESDIGVRQRDVEMKSND
jgi:hypothetical protein